MRTSEFLVFKKADYISLMESIPEANDTQNKLFSFLSESILFASLRFDPKSLTPHCDIRIISPNCSILTEGDEPECVFFIISGECNILRTLYYIQEKTSSGRVLNHKLSLKFQGSSDERFGDVSFNDAVDLYHLDHIASTSEFVFHKKLVKLDTIGPGCNFGQQDGFIEISDNSDINSLVSIVSKGAVEVIGVNQVEFQRYTTSGTSEVR